MQFHEIGIEPRGGFGTPIKGDTLFGHFCWQAAYDASLIEGGLDRGLEMYGEKPFLIFSSAFPKIRSPKEAYALKRPDMPFHMLSLAKGERVERMRRHKQLKAKKWMLVEDLSELDLGHARFLTDEDLGEEIVASSEKKKIPVSNNQPQSHCFLRSQSHNSINRMTQTTRKGFAPFSTDTLWFLPGVHLAVFALIDPEATDVNRVCKALDRIGACGFGKDASTGMGRFSVAYSNPLHLTKRQAANACYTLAPFVPEKMAYRKLYFSPFVRFGKHGDRLACSRNPFKTPVVMADEGAVLVPSLEHDFGKPYLGSAVTGVSKVAPEAVVQGYAPYLPVKLEG